jgi:cytochrome c oxidase assembly protein subunit 15
MQPKEGTLPRAAAPGPDRAVVFEPWRHRFALAVAVAAAGLLAAGGLVTSTGSGLAVPDWPLSFGQLFPPMVGGVLFEHGHRMVASAVGFMTMILMFWFRAREPRPAVRWLAYAAFFGVVAQGGLGGMTVLMRLPIAVSVAHACLAQVVFCLLVTLALVTSRRFITAGLSRTLAPDRPLARLTAAGSGVVFIQLFLGAVMRHSGAGLAIPDFPLSFGYLVPPQFTADIAIHFAHRVGALIVSLVVIWIGARAIRHRRPELAGPARLAVALVLLQVSLGATAVLTRLAVLPTTTHLLVGALLLATLMVLTVRASQSVCAEAPAVARVGTTVEGLT